MTEKFLELTPGYFIDPQYKTILLQLGLVSFDAVFSFSAGEDLAKKNLAPYRKRFYEGANSAFIVADLTRPQTLKNIEIWYTDIKKFVSPDINIILVGNKSDLVEDIKKIEEELKYLANKFGFHYIFTSAKTGENVNDSFLYMAYKLLESI